MSTEEVKSHKAPARTCVACGKSGDKNDLVRFVRSKDGLVSCDRTGRAQGRGAYVCACVTCFTTAEKRKRLDWALKHTLVKEDYRRLEETFRDVCAKQEQII